MSSSADDTGEALVRRLGIWSAGAVVVGSTIGSGIFRTPAVIAERIPDVSLFWAVWIIGAVVALCGALSYAELGGMFPRTGGMYVYIREAFGDLPAFLFGWAELVILRPASYGAIALTSSEYGWRVFGIDAGVLEIGGIVSLAQATAGLLIISVGWINIRGLEHGARVQNISTLLKIAALVGLVALGMGFVATPVASEAVASPTTGVSLSSLGVALVAVLWAYDGWADVGFVGGEIRDAKRNLPRAFILGTLTVAVLYLATNLVYTRVVPLAQMPGSPLIAADVAQRLVGPVGVLLIAGAVSISTFGTLNGTLMTAPRIFYAMARDGLFFRSLSAVHPRHGTPARAISLSILLGVVFVSIRSFAELADQFIIGMWPFYALSIVAVFVFRRRMPDRERPYRTWGYPVVPAVFLVATVFLLGSYLIEQPVTFAADLIILAIGVPVFYAWRRRR